MCPDRPSRRGRPSSRGTSECVQRRVEAGDAVTRRAAARSCTSPRRDAASDASGWTVPAHVAALSPALTCARRASIAYPCKSRVKLRGDGHPLTTAHVPARFLSVADLDPAGIVDVLARARALKPGRSPAADSAAARREVRSRSSSRSPACAPGSASRSGSRGWAATPVVLSGEEVGLGSREVPRDVAHTLERYVDAIVARVFDHSLLEDLADAVSDPGHQRPLGRGAPLPGAGGSEVLRGAPRASLQRTPAGVSWGMATTWRRRCCWRARRSGCTCGSSAPPGYEPDPVIVASRAADRARRRARASSSATDPVTAVGGRGRGLHGRVGEHGPGGQAERRRDGLPAVCR